MWKCLDFDGKLVFHLRKIQKDLSWVSMHCAMRSRDGFASASSVCGKVGRHLCKEKASFSRVSSLIIRSIRPNVSYLMSDDDDDDAFSRKPVLHYIVIECRVQSLPLFSPFALTKPQRRASRERSDARNEWEKSLPESIKKSHFMFHVLCKMS